MKNWIDFAFTFFIAGMMTSPAFAQVVNIESQRIQSDSDGVFGSIGANFSVSSNTKTAVVLDASAQVEYKQDKNLFLFLASYGFVSGDQEAFSNNAFAHLRYNRKIGPVLRWEGFTQIQFNKISKIKLRYLLGTGPRFKIFSNNTLQFYAGTAAMYEYEDDDTTEHRYHNDIRSSTYFSVTLTPGKNVHIVGTVYYQPLFADFADFRVLNEEAIQVIVSKKFTIEPKFNFLHDSEPVSGVPHDTYYFTTTFKYTF
jgi:hypothetical protein